MLQGHCGVRERVFRIYMGNGKLIRLCDAEADIKRYAAVLLFNLI